MLKKRIPVTKWQITDWQKHLLYSEAVINIVVCSEVCVIMTGPPPIVDEQRNSSIKASEPASADLPSSSSPPSSSSSSRCSKQVWLMTSAPTSLALLRCAVTRLQDQFPAEIFCCRKRVHRPLYIPCFASALWDDDEDSSLACRTLTFDRGLTRKTALSKNTSYESWLCVCEAFCWSRTELNCAPDIPACMSKPWSSSFTGWRYFHIESLHLSRSK